MYLFNSHGPDHGLSVYLDGHDITIRQWVDASNYEEDGEEYQHIQEATIPLRTLLDPTLPHAAMRSPGERSVTGSVVGAALAWLAYWGGEEIPTDGTPCQEFLNYGGAGSTARNATLPHMTCALCGGKPSRDHI
jgi:hypothetical protein